MTCSWPVLCTGPCMKQFLHILGVMAFAMALAASPAFASAPSCEGLAARAAVAAGIPDGVLPAIARTESGGGPRASAWPWTLNVQGRGYYFDTREEALAHLRQVLASGVRSVDVGCMQINFRWHGQEFASIEQMIDPEFNTAYAARFVQELRAREGSWDAAVRNYHSSNAERGRAYLARVQRNAGRIEPDAELAQLSPPREQAPLGATSPQTRNVTDGRFSAQSRLVSVSPRSAGAPLAELVLIPANLPEGQLPNLGPIFMQGS